MGLAQTHAGSRAEGTWGRRAVQGAGLKQEVTHPQGWAPQAPVPTTPCTTADQPLLLGKGQAQLRHLGLH